MGPREWFGVGVRLFGIWCLIMAAQHLFYYLDVRLGFSPMSSIAGRADPDGNPSGYLVYVIGFAMAGGALLLLADPIIGIAYPSAVPESESESEDATELYDR